ncbi:MAG: AAA family ATPase [Actinomycetales bacterium]
MPTSRSASPGSPALLSRRALMSGDSRSIRPADRSWTVAVYVRGSEKPKGSGVLIDRRRVLTCRHVVEDLDLDGLVVAFPAATEDPFGEPIPVSTVHPATHKQADVAVLTLSKPAPPDAIAAPLRNPTSGALVGASWWAFGFHDDIGDSADGQVGEDLTSGWVRLDSESRYHIMPRFSGAGVWSSQYQAVIGLVGQKRETGDGRALTVHAISKVLPEHDLAALTELYRLEDSGVEAAAEWGWQLADDVEGRRHWRPRARGVTHDGEPGWRFSGRRTALTQIVDWLTEPEVPRAPLVVTGSPGVGKSAVLARIVTTADAAVVAQMPADDAVRAPVGSIACAVHAKGKQALDVAVEIARAASATIPERLEDAVPAIREALAERTLARGGETPFVVVVDALDEAETPDDARTIARDLLRPLAEDCADVGVRVLVGTRRHDDDGPLIDSLGRARGEIDLDDASYVRHEDLASYALATLQLRGNPRASNPYHDDTVAGAVAQRIADISAPNFLVAGLLARQHGLHDIDAVDPATITLPGDHDHVQVALDRYLARMNGIGDLTPRQVLLPLAYAESPGLTSTLWAIALAALTGTQIDAHEVEQFATGSAANFLIQSAASSASFRLFHQALNDTLIQGREEATDQRAIAQAFIGYGGDLGWAEAPAYLLRSLPQHARAGGVVDDLLTETTYLLYSDLRRLIPVGVDARTAPARAAATLIRRTPWAIGQAAPDRLAMFSIIDALDCLDTGVGEVSRSAPYRATWADATPRQDVATLTGHTDWVRAVCAIRVQGRDLLATASNDATVRIWDPTNGTTTTTLTGHTDWVNAVCAIRVQGRDLLATASHDDTVRIWDPTNGTTTTTLTGHTDWVRAVCAIRVQGRDLLATASNDRTVRIWDPTRPQENPVVIQCRDVPQAITSDRPGSLCVGLDVGVLSIDVENAGSVVA